MKELNCEAVCLQIEESDLGWVPDGAIRQHLRRCDPCERFYEERMKLRQMVGSLETVPAPADFDFKLRARLRNEQPSASRFTFGGLALNYRSIALATFMVILGLAFVFRASFQRRTQVATSTGNTQQTTPAAIPAEPQVKSTDQPAAVVQTKEPEINKAPVVRQKPRSPRTESQLAVVNKRTRSKDSSIEPAPVVKREESVADAGAGFPIDASYDSIKMSLDDSSGVSRTISLPRVSFGSQRVFSGEPASIVKASTKGIW